MKNQEKLEKLEKIACLHPVPYPTPRPPKGRKKVVAEAPPKFTKTENGYIYEKFHPNFVPRKSLSNRTLCENQPVILSNKVLETLSQAKEVKEAKFPLQFKKVATVVDYLVMERHLRLGSS